MMPPLEKGLVLLIVLKFNQENRTFASRNKQDESIYGKIN